MLKVSPALTVYQAKRHMFSLKMEFTFIKYPPMGFVNLCEVNVSYINFSVQWSL